MANNGTTVVDCGSAQMIFLSFFSDAEFVGELDLFSVRDLIFFGAPAVLRWAWFI